jgi:ABC-type oligopeptide transport system substrate-binding subunit
MMSQESKKGLSRRKFVVLTGGALVASGILAACGDNTATTAPATTAAATTAAATTAASAATTAASAATTAASATTAAAAATTAAAAGAAGVLPADAAPADQQVYVNHFDSTADATCLDFYESVYKRGGFADMQSDSLVRLDKNFKTQPGAALKWAVDSSGLVWSFNLDPNLMWSDDTPVTADDYVATFQYGADPKHAWDFTWYFGGVIKNWNEAVAGKVPLDQLGVKAADAHTLQFTTESPAPYLPAMLLYSTPLQKKALTATGSGLYNADPKTTVSSGPFILKEWTKGNRIVLEANPKYKGTNKPLFQKLVAVAAAPSSDFASYQANEIDFVGGAVLSPADNALIAQDPTMKSQVHPQPGDFRTDYLFFDTKKPPFDNLKVRQAFSHIVDRDAIIKSIITPSQGLPAYSFLMPGFPASNSKALAPIQNYDVAAAKSALAEAGFPDGKGFPKLTLWLRNEAPVRVALAQAIAASIKQNLGIDVDVSNKESKTFTDAMNAKPTQIQFGMVNYGMDFLDPYNMLSVWLSGGRHNWNNTTFDDAVKKAASFTGDPAERIKMFQDAEKILVSDVGGVFIYHRYVSDLYKNYMKGSELEPDQNGVAALHWPGYAGFSQSVSSVYMSKDASTAGRKLPK